MKIKHIFSNNVGILVEYMFILNQVNLRESEESEQPSATANGDSDANSPENENIVSESDVSRALDTLINLEFNKDEIRDKEKISRSLFEQIQKRVIFPNSLALLSSSVALHHQLPPMSVMLMNSVGRTN